MHINIEFLVIAYFVTLFIDWVFQWNWQAFNKSKWSRKDNIFTSWLALFSHSFIYTILSTIIIFGILTGNVNWLFADCPTNIVTTFITLLVSHIIIDTRIPVKWIMRFKGMSREQINDIQNFGFMHIGIDHRLHELVLLILAMFV
jgi:hypothetical protein